MPTEGGDTEGHILVFDRKALTGELTPVPFVDEQWNGQDEHEEAVAVEIAPLSDYLIAIIPLR